MFSEAVIKMEEPPVPEGLELEEHARRGDDLFRQYLPDLRPHYRGQAVVIDPISGDYFVGEDGKTASELAEEKYPDRLFYIAVVPEGPKLRKGPTPRYSRPTELRDRIGC